MKFTVAAVISALLSSSLASPRPDAEADPGYRVVKTVQIWDDEKDDTQLHEDIDLIPGVFEDEIYEDADLDVDFTPQLEDQILNKKRVAPQIFKVAEERNLDNETIAQWVGRGGSDDHLLPSPLPRGTHFLYFCFQIILAGN